MADMHCTKYIDAHILTLCQQDTKMDKIQLLIEGYRIQIYFYPYQSESLHRAKHRQITKLLNSLKN